MRQLGVLVVVIAAAAVLTGCGSSSSSVPGVTHVQPLQNPGLPATIGGLAVQPADVRSTLAQSLDPHYVDQVALVTLSSVVAPQRVEATLEVAQYAAGTDIGSASIRDQLVRGIGSSEAFRVDVGGDVASVTRARNTTIAVWFRATRMYVLSVRTDYGGTKDLVRAALGATR